MAAILCRVFFVEPCRAVGRCVSSACDCCGQICDEIGKCCDSICNMFDKPFSCCLIFSGLLNISALIYSLLSLVSGTNDTDACGDNPIQIFLILLMVFTILNSLFSFYVFRAMNSEEMLQYIDGQAVKQSSPDGANQSVGNKAWQFFQYNPYFAGYLCCVFVPMLVILILSMGYRCDESTMSIGLFWSSVLLFIYIGIGLLVLLSYVAIEVLKEMAHNCCWWFVPCLWPCLCIGCCINYAEEHYDHDTQSQRPVRGQQNKGANQGYQQAQSYPSAPTQPIQQQPVTLVIAQPVQPIQQSQPQVQPNWQPHYTSGGPAANAQPQIAQPQQQQQYYNNNNNYNNQYPSHPPASNQMSSTGAPQQVSGSGQPGASDPKSNKEVAAEYAKKGGVMAAQGGKKALGFLAKNLKKGVDKLDSKLNENQTSEGREGK